MRASEQELRARSSVDAVRDSEQETPSLLIGVVEAGAALGASRTAVYAMIRENRFPLPVLRVGDRFRVSRKALEDFIARGE